jgi:hypothetical protein
MTMTVLFTNLANKMKPYLRYILYEFFGYCRQSTFGILQVGHPFPYDFDIYQTK